MWFYWCFIITLLTWQAWGQAPDDFDEACRTGNNELAHIFPPDWVLMLDSFDYSSLVSAVSPTAVWEARDFDGDGNEWLQQIGGACTWGFITNSFTGGQQSNWLFTQYISYRESLEVFFNISYNLRNCRDNPACSNAYITLYRFDTDMLPEDSPQIVNVDNYEPLFGTVANSRLEPPPPPMNNVNVKLNLQRPESSGFYLGIQDDGTAANFGRVLVYYRVVRGRMESLLSCPDVPLPPQDSTTTSEMMCSCVMNASPTSSLSRICNADGMCNEDQVCGCDPGFELTGGSCTACAENTFKVGVSNSSCLACPINSESRGEGNAVCDCIPPNIRNPERPQDPCTTPPSSPRLILSGGGAPVVRQNSITVCWLPALDSGGLENDLRYNIYLYDTSLEEPIYDRVNVKFINETDRSDGSFCYPAPITDNDISYGVLVVSANSATGDPQVLTNVSEIQDRFLVFFVALGGDLVPEGRCDMTIAVVVTLFVTLLLTAVITTILVVVIMWYCWKDSTQSNSTSDRVKYHGGYDKTDINTGTSKPHPSQAYKPAPPGPSRKPPPRPPNKPAHA